MIRSVLVASFVLAQAAHAQEPLALVGGMPVAETDLQSIIGPELLELRQREAQLKEEALEEVISRRLVEAEARARGMSPEALLKAEVEDKVVVSSEEIKAFYEANRARIGALPEAEALRRIEPVLRQQKVHGLEAALLRDLRAKTSVRVLMEPMRSPVSAVGPSRGPVDAPITIVEFSDFQCPFCERVQPALRQVFETYGDKIRLVYRDFPLEMHKDAGRAAAAATCAGEQGKFWDMHEKIFSNQSALAPDRLGQYASEIGVDTAKFEACMVEPRHAEALRKSMEEGKSFGVQGTPAFFINGRRLIGAQPFDSFARIIDDELARFAEKKAASITK